MPETTPVTETIPFTERETPAAPVGAILQSAQLRIIASEMRGDPLVAWLQAEVYKPQIDPDDPNTSPSRRQPTAIFLRKTLHEQVPFYWETLITIGHSTEVLTTTIADCESVGADPQLRGDAIAKISEFLGVSTAVSSIELLDDLLRRALQRHRLRLDLHRQSWALWQDQVHELKQLHEASGDSIESGHVSIFVERFLTWQSKRTLLADSMTAADLPVPAVPDASKLFELVVPTLIVGSGDKPNIAWYDYILNRTEKVIAAQIDLSRVQAQERLLANLYRAENPFERYGLGGAPPDLNLFRLIRENQLQGGVESVWLAHWKKQIALSPVSEKEEPQPMLRFRFRRGRTNPAGSKKVLNIGATLPSAQKSWSETDLEYVKLVSDSVIKQRTLDKWQHGAIADEESLNSDIGELFEQIVANFTLAVARELGDDFDRSAVKDTAEVLTANIVNLATELNRSGYQFKPITRLPGDPAVGVGITRALSPLFGRSTLLVGRALPDVAGEDTSENK